MAGAGACPRAAPPPVRAGGPGSPAKPSAQEQPCRSRGPRGPASADRRRSRAWRTPRGHRLPGPAGRGRGRGNRWSGANRSAALRPPPQSRTGSCPRRVATGAGAAGAGGAEPDHPALDEPPQQLGGLILGKRRAREELADDGLTAHLREQHPLLGRELERGRGDAWRHRHHVHRLPLADALLPGIQSFCLDTPRLTEKPQCECSPGRARVKAPLAARSVRPPSARSRIARPSSSWASVTTYGGAKRTVFGPATLTRSPSSRQRETMGPASPFSSTPTSRPRPRTSVTIPGRRAWSARAPAMQVLALARVLGEERRVAHLAQHHVGRGAGHRVAAERGAVGARSERAAHVLAAEHRPDRQAVAERLGAADRVREDALALEGEDVAGAAHAGLDLVDQQQQALRIGELAQGLAGSLRARCGRRPPPGWARPGSPRSAAPPRRAPPRDRRRARGESPAAAARSPAGTSAARWRRASPACVRGSCCRRR